MRLSQDQSKSSFQRLLRKIKHANPNFKLTLRWVPGTKGFTGMKRWTKQRKQRQREGIAPVPVSLSQNTFVTTCCRSVSQPSSKPIENAPTPDGPKSGPPLLASSTSSTLTPCHQMFLPQTYVFLLQAPHWPPHWTSHSSPPIKPTPLPSNKSRFFRLSALPAD